VQFLITEHLNEPKPL